MSVSEIEAIAAAMVAPGKGVLAADESTGTMEKRLQAAGVEPSEEARRAFRELLFTADGMAEHVSGVIMFDETLRQSTGSGTPFPEYLAARDVLPGIKVDTGAKPLSGAPGETVTEGLDGLRGRLAEYSELGARFAKWRAVIAIGGESMPSRRAIEVNAHALARYAALCQEAGVVPIVEPEVLMDGDHPIERSEQVTGRVLHEVFDALFEQGVRLEGIVLKPNMVLSGYSCPEQARVEEVAERGRERERGATDLPPARALQRSCPGRPLVRGAGRGARCLSSLRRARGGGSGGSGANARVSPACRSPRSTWRSHPRTCRPPRSPWSSTCCARPRPSLRPLPADTSGCTAARRSTRPLPWGGAAGSWAARATASSPPTSRTVTRRRTSPAADRWARSSCSPRQTARLRSPPPSATHRASSCWARCRTSTR